MRQKDRIDYCRWRHCAWWNATWTGRIVDLDDLTIGFDGVGHINRLLEGVGHSLSDRGFTVSRRAVDQNGPAGIGRRTEPPDDILGENQDEKWLSSVVRCR